MRFIFLFAALFWTATLLAQTDGTIHFMQQLPQSNYSNPGTVPDNKLYIGLPILGSTLVTHDKSGFSYRNFLMGKSSLSNPDLEYMLGQVSGFNSIHTTIHADIISLGFKTPGKHYINLGATEKISSRIAFPGEMSAIFHGTHPDMLRLDHHFDDFGMDFSHYREYFAGYTRQLHENFSAGLRLKYLYGMENISTRQSMLQVKTSTKDFTASADGSVEILTSGLSPFINHDEEGGPIKNMGQYLFGKNNHGLGIDAGINYSPGPFTFSLNVSDIGFIKWNDDNYTLKAEDFSYSFNAFEQQKSGATSENSFWDTLNTPENLMESDEAYTTTLNAKTFLGAGIHINKNNKANILMQKNFGNSLINSAYSLQYHTKLTPHLWVTGNYTMLPGRKNNFGLGLSTSGALQFYFVTDNAISIFQSEPDRMSSTRFGVNLTFGRDD